MACSLHGETGGEAGEEKREGREKEEAEDCPATAPSGIKGPAANHTQPTRGVVTKYSVIFNIFYFQFCCV